MCAGVRCAGVQCACVQVCSVHVCVHVCAVGGREGGREGGGESSFIPRTRLSELLLAVSVILYLLCELMNGCVFLREMMLYTACRTALLLRTSNVYTYTKYQAIGLVENTSREGGIRGSCSPQLQSCGPQLQSCGPQLQSCGPQLQSCGPQLQSCDSNTPREVLPRSVQGMGLVKSALWRLVYLGVTAEGERYHVIISFSANFNSHAACRPLPKMLSSVTMYWVGGREGEERGREGRGDRRGEWVWV